MGYHLHAVLLLKQVQRPDMVDVGMGYQGRLKPARVEFEPLDIGNELVEAPARTRIDKHQVAGIDEVDTAVIGVRDLGVPHQVDVFPYPQGIGHNF